MVYHLDSNSVVLLDVMMDFDYLLVVLMDLMLVQLMVYPLDELMVE